MDLRPILNILADGNFHSGASLGRTLRHSRTVIWKQLNELRELGLELHAVTGKGYRLPTAMQLLAEDRILAALRMPVRSAHDLFRLHLSIPSTNTEAMQLAKQGVERFLVLAEHQSQGRGRRGRNWVSPLGSNLYMSLIWAFPAGVATLEGLSLVVALTVVRALRGAGVQGLGVKWPNDVLQDHGKLAGILLEVQGDVSGPCNVVIGIGVNINMPGSAAKAIDQRFSDLAGQSGQVMDRNLIAAALIDELFQAMDEFSRRGFGPWQQEWESLDVYLGKEVEVSSGATSIKGRVTGVDRGGALLLNTPQGVQALSGGEVFPTVRPLS